MISAIQTKTAKVHSPYVIQQRRRLFWNKPDIDFLPRKTCKTTIMTGVIFASVICFLRLQEGVFIHKIIEIWVKIGLISVKFKVYTNFPITKRLFIEIFFVHLQRTIIAMFIAIEVRRVLSWWHTRQPTPCWVWRSHNDKAVQSGHWVGKIVQTYWRRLLYAVFETHWNLANESAL